jgi:hypothetical protein
MRSPGLGCGKQLYSKIQAMASRKFHLKYLAQTWMAICLLASFLPAGCVGVREGWTSYPTAKTVKNPYFEAQVKPARRYGGDGPYHGFFLHIKNLSRDPLEIVWEKTYYIDKRKNRGGFIVGEGDENDHPYFPSPPRRIYPGRFFQDNLWPKYMAQADQDNPDQFVHQTFKPGTHGVYLTIRYHGLAATAILPPQPDEENYPWIQGAGSVPPYKGSPGKDIELPVFLPLSIVLE